MYEICKKGRRLNICGQGLACPDSARDNNANWSRNNPLRCRRCHRCCSTADGAADVEVAGVGAGGDGSAAVVAVGASTLVIGAARRC